MQNISNKSITSLLLAKVYFFGSVFLVGSPAASAHEYWLEPKSYTLNVGDTLVADIKNGVDFKGISYPYLKNDIVTLEAVTSSGRLPIGGRNGDSPALKTQLKSNGLHSIAFLNDASRITFQKWEKFASYVKDEGAEWVVQRHLDLGLAKEKVKEIYSRCAKTLVQVGPLVTGETDRYTGMPAELVASQNPYALQAGDRLELSLYWQGKPRANNQLRVFEKSGNLSNGDQKLRQFDLTTDVNGVASFVPVAGAEYLLSSVVIFENGTEGTVNEDDVAWESYWASLTFKTAP